MEPDINAKVVPSTPGNAVDPASDFDLDPRSPTYGIPRTPLVTILKSRTDLMRSEADLAKILDPRSPTVGITRTPVVGTVAKKVKEDSATPSYHHLKSKCAKPFDLKKLLDPRSPTVGITRTPVVGIDAKKVKEDSATPSYHQLKSKCAKPFDLRKLIDPRSPTVDFNRTPVQLEKKAPKENVKQQMEVGDALKDPRSPAQDFTRTPLQMTALEKKELPEVKSVEVVRHIDFQASPNTTVTEEEEAQLEEGIKTLNVSTNSQVLEEPLNAAVEADLVQNVEKFSTPCAKTKAVEEIAPESSDAGKTEMKEVKVRVMKTTDVRKTKSFIFDEEQQKFSTPKNFAKLRFSQKFDSASPSRSPLSTLGGKNSPKVDKNHRVSLGLEQGMRKRIGWNPNNNNNVNRTSGVDQNKEN